jgi:hypothetical protein
MIENIINQAAKQPELILIFLAAFAVCCWLYYDLEVRR